MKNKGYAFKLTFLNHSFALFLSSKYCLKYRLNEVTTAIDGTVGIFCFRSLEDIREFFPNTNFDDGFSLYLVEGYKRKKTPELISFPYNHYIQKFYEGIIEFPTETPEGTVCYESIMPIRIITQEEFEKGELNNGK